MNPVLKFDGTIARLERFITGHISPNVYLLVARVIFGFPLMMNGVGQLMMPDLIKAQMGISGIDPVWALPATLASLLGGLAILVGWRVRLASLLLIVYVVAATLLVHNTHSLLANGVDIVEIPGTTVTTMNMRSGEETLGPLRLPRAAIDNCEWFIHEYRKLSGAALTDEFVLGCSLYRIEFDGGTSMRHFTMFVPALILLIALGGGRFSAESWLKNKRKKATG